MALHRSHFRNLGLALAASLFLAACDTAEERAEAHYQSGLTLLEEGDVDRALVEFRNVFKLDGLHRDARLTYAEVMRDQGNTQEAFSHYLLLAEQFPDDVLPRKWLFRLAMLSGNLEEAEKHGGRAVQIQPQDAEVQAIDAILAYHDALAESSPSGRRDAAARLLDVSGDVEDPQVYLPTLIDNHLRENKLDEAIAGIDALLETEPLQEQWQTLRLRVLSRMGDPDRVRDQLELMVTLFPDVTDYPAALVKWHLARDNAEDAETFLRDWSTKADGQERIDREVQLVAFLSGSQGPEAALEELDRLIGENAEAAPPLFRAMQAGLLYDRGDEDEAITRMEAIVANAPEELTRDEQEELHDIEVNLALMQIDSGREEDARASIASVLEEDSSHVGALKQSAQWLIEADRADDAIVELRTALGRAPDDPQIMTLIAEAHIRNGSRDLAGEMLSLAVEAVENAPRESLAYGRFLLADRNYRAAEDVVTKSLRGAPTNVDLLTLLGRIYVDSSDWSRAEQVEATLRRLGTVEAVASADALRVDWYRAQERGDEALRFLSELAEGDGTGAAEIAVARTHMQNGNFDEAEAFITAQLDADPKNPDMRMLMAALMAQTNRGDEAETILRSLVSEDPSREIVWRTLYETKARVGETAAASAVLDEALAAVPDAPDLLWIKAGELERFGDVEGAIAIYEDLYERLPNSPIVANNLASLLSSQGADADTIDRAYTIARRLRGSDIPAFQDTYGWIAHQRGYTREAIEHLEAASAALPNEPSVLYHLGAAYAASGDTESAIEALTRAIEIYGDAVEAPGLVAAQAELDRILTPGGN